jgi:hypothetical protein
VGQRTEAYDREKLYEEIWKEPALVVAKRYSISSVALAKACRKLSVPLPPRGYWARVRARRIAPPPPPLPPYDNSSGVQSTRLIPEKSDGASRKKEVHEKDERGRANPAAETTAPPKNTVRNTVGEPKRNWGRRTPEEIPEYLYCTIDGWQRTFRFGVYRFPSIKGLLEKEGGYDDWDHLQIFGTVRYHQPNRKVRKRTGQRVELWVSPEHTPRKEWRDDPEAIGGVWTEEGKLFGACRIASDAFYSLFPCLAADRFKELEIKIRGMRYRRGKLDSIELSPKETPMEDLLA